MFRATHHDNKLNTGSAVAAAASTTRLRRKVMSSILPATAAEHLICVGGSSIWYCYGCYADDDNVNNPSSDMILDEKTTAVENKLWGVLDEWKSGETDTQQKWNAHLDVAVARRNKCLSQATYDNKEMFTRWKIRMFMLNCYLWILDLCRLSLTCSPFQPNLGQLGV